MAVVQMWKTAELRQAHRGAAPGSSQVCQSCCWSTRPYTEARGRVTAAAANSRAGGKYAARLLIEADQSEGGVGGPGRGILGMEMRRECGTLLRVWKTFLLGIEAN